MHDIFQEARNETTETAMKSAETPQATIMLERLETAPLDDIDWRLGESFTQLDHKIETIKRLFAEAGLASDAPTEKRVKDAGEKAHKATEQALFHELHNAGTRLPADRIRAYGANLTKHRNAAGALFDEVFFQNRREALRAAHVGALHSLIETLERLADVSVPPAPGLPDYAAHAAAIQRHKEIIKTDGLMKHTFAGMQDPDFGKIWALASDMRIDALEQTCRTRCHRVGMEAMIALKQTGHGSMDCPPAIAIAKLAESAKRHLEAAGEWKDGMDDDTAHAERQAHENVVNHHFTALNTIHVRNGKKPLTDIADIHIKASNHIAYLGLPEDSHVQAMHQHLAEYVRLALIWKTGDFLQRCGTGTWEFDAVGGAQKLLEEFRITGTNMSGVVVMGKSIDAIEKIADGAYLPPAPSQRLWNLVVTRFTAPRVA